MNIGKISSTFNNAVYGLTQTKAMQNSTQRVANTIDKYTSKGSPANALDILTVCTKIAVEAPKAYLGALAEKITNVFH